MHGLICSFLMIGTGSIVYSPARLLTMKHFFFPPHLVSVSKQTILEALNLVPRSFQRMKLRENDISEHPQNCSYFLGKI